MACGLFLYFLLSKDGFYIFIYFIYIIIIIIINLTIGHAY